MIPSKTLSRSLQTLHTSAAPPNYLPSVPPELLEYVENGRNPDIYTREFVELVRRGNQLMRGKMHAFGSFRDVLAADLATAMPELRKDVETVCEATGGKVPPPAIASSTSAVGTTEESALGGEQQQQQQQLSQTAQPQPPAQPEAGGPSSAAAETAS